MSSNIPISRSSLPPLLEAYFTKGLEWRFEIAGEPILPADIFYGGGLFPAICHVAKEYLKEMFDVDLEFTETVGQKDVFTSINLQDFQPHPTHLVLMAMVVATIELLKAHDMPRGAVIDVTDTYRELSKLYAKRQ